MIDAPDIIPHQKPEDICEHIEYALDKIDTLTRLSLYVDDAHDAPVLLAMIVVMISDYAKKIRGHVDALTEQGRCHA